MNLVITRLPMRWMRTRGPPSSIRATLTSKPASSFSAPAAIAAARHPHLNRLMCTLRLIRPLVLPVLSVLSGEAPRSSLPPTYPRRARPVLERTGHVGCPMSTRPLSHPIPMRAGSSSVARLHPRNASLVRCRSRRCGSLTRKPSGAGPLAVVHHQARPRTYTRMVLLLLLLLHRRARPLLTDELPIPTGPDLPRP